MTQNKNLCSGYQSSEVANIQLRFITGDSHKEQGYPLLTLLKGVNEKGIVLKYVTTAQLQLPRRWASRCREGDMSPPRAIYPLNPGRMRVKLDKTTLPYKLSHYEY